MSTSPSTTPSLDDIIASLPWHADHENLLALCTYLVEEEGYDANQLLHAIEKPWHYEDEWAALCEKRASDS